MKISQLFLDASFDPEQAKAMEFAYEAACINLRDRGHSETIGERVADFIVEFSKSGERDAKRLCAKTLKAIVREA